MTIACSRPNKDHRPAQWSGSVSYANRRGADVHVKFWLYQWRRAGSLPAFGFDRSFSPWSSGAIEPDWRHIRIADDWRFRKIDVIETSETKGLNGSWTRSTRKNARKLLTPDELGRIPSDRCVYLLRGIPPFSARGGDW